MLHKRIFCVLLTLSFVLQGCSKSGDNQLGSRNNPVKIYFTPSVDSETITTNSEEFIRFLEKETGFYFKTGVPASYVAVVEAFGSNRADVAVMNSFGYLLANKKYGAEAKMTVIRYGEKYYRGQIIAHVDSGIKSIKDIKGKRFAFTDASSTPGYLFPLKMMKERGVSPGNSTFAVKHDSVVTMVYQKQVDAGATYYSAPSDVGEIRDARARVKTQFPDVEDKVKIIALTEKILNDPFVFRKGLKSELVDKIVKAIFKFINLPAGKKIFKNIYSVEGLVQARDSDYDGLRKMLEVNEINPLDMLTKK